MTTGVYALVDPDGNAYIGASGDDVLKRLKSHWRSLAEGKHHNHALQKAYDRGVVFENVVLAQVNDCRFLGDIEVGIIHGWPHPVYNRAFEVNPKQAQRWSEAR